MMARDYRSEPYPLSPIAEAALHRDKEAERTRARARTMRDHASLAQSAIDGAHGPTAKALAEEGITTEHRGHVRALARWAEVYGSRPLEADESRSIKSALDALNLEHSLRIVAVEVRKEIAATPAKGARR